MDNVADYLVLAFMWLMGIVLAGVIVFGTMGLLSAAEGVVSDKYYDDQDLVCSKGCVIVPECWTIKVDSEPWWNKTMCVSESKYHTISIGDYFRE